MHVDPAVPGRPDAAGWQARLALRFAARDGVTRLVHNRHEGPLRLIRALPLPDGRCQAVIVHPPGGLVGGDRLRIDLSLESGARVLCTTPGAQKWYRSPGAAATATTRIDVGPAARLEWLPQPAIVYDAALVEQAIDFDLSDDARMIGWECLVLGRAAMGERFANGALRQRLSLSVAAMGRAHRGARRRTAVHVPAGLGRAHRRVHRVGRRAGAGARRCGAPGLAGLPGAGLRRRGRARREAARGRHARDAGLARSPPARR